MNIWIRCSTQYCVDPLIQLFSCKTFIKNFYFCPACSIQDIRQILKTWRKGKEQKKLNMFQFGRTLVDCPTQLTLIFILWYLYFMTNIKVTNMKKYSREICYWQARLPNRNQISYNEICALWQGQPLKIGTKNINLNSKIEISSEISTIEKHEKCWACLAQAWALW